MEKSLNYSRARSIRNSGLGDLISKNLMNDRGLGSSIGEAVSDKFKAKVVGIKEKFDPLNIAKKLTGNVGATLFGKMTGRSKTDISHFTGISGSRNEDPLYTKISDGQNQRMRKGDALADVLARLYNLTKKYHTEEVKKMEDESIPKKLRQEEKQKWQEEILKAIKNLSKNLKLTTTKEESEEKEKSSNLDHISGVPGDSKGEIKKVSIMSRILQVLPEIASVLVPILAIEAIHEAVVENEKIKKEIDKNPNAPGLEDNLYAMEKRGEGKNFQAVAHKNTGKAIKQLNTQTVKELIDSKLSDDELKNETGKTRADLQEWIKLNPKSMLKINTDKIKPGQKIIKDEAAETVENTRLAEIERSQTPNTAVFGKYPNMKPTIRSSQKITKDEGDTTIENTRLAEIERSQIPNQAVFGKYPNMKPKIEPVTTENTLATKVQQVINQNNDLKLDESVAGKTIVLDNSKTINSTVPGQDDYKQPGSIPVRNSEDSMNMCIRKNYRAV
jgi:hypothetical protein